MGNPGPGNQPIRNMAPGGMPPGGGMPKNTLFGDGKDPLNAGG